MHGSMVFRGPKVKMGIYGGVPTRVLPHNTTGRADYFGPLVNRSARLCHAAARGGQVGGATAPALAFAMVGG
jgi:class 3 adenylate cyclase